MATAGEGSVNGQSLYMCFSEYSKDGKVSYVITSIDLFSVPPLELQHVSRISGKKVPIFMGCGVYGSKIVFAGGFNAKFKPAKKRFKPSPSTDGCAHAYAYETNPSVDPNPRINPYYELPPFPQQQPQPLLWELGGKLYALARFSPDLSEDMSSPLPEPSWFQVFDPDNDGGWSSLPNPTWYDSGSLSDWGFRNFSYAVVGTNIFVSHTHLPMQRFNIASCRGEWEEKWPISKFYDPAIGFTIMEGVFLIFSLAGDPDEGVCYNYISVHLLSSDGNVILHQSNPLPRVAGSSVFQTKGGRFVHLGGQLVCLVLFGVDFVRGADKIYIQVFTFEFKMVNINTTLAIEANFKPTQVIEYVLNQETDDAQMIGAFLL